jgi:hypothetical protein
VGLLSNACKFSASSIWVLVHSFSAHGCRPARWKHPTCRRIYVWCPAELAHEHVEPAGERRETQAQDHLAAITPPHDVRIAWRHALVVRLLVAAPEGHGELDRLAIARA